MFPLARSITETVPPAPAAASRLPSGESARAITGAGPSSTDARTVPSWFRSRTVASAPAAAISPSAATASVLTALGSVATESGSPMADQTRTVASAPAVTGSPSGRKATALTLP